MPRMPTQRWTPKSPNNAASTLFNTVHLFPKDLRFEGGTWWGRQTCFCPGHHIASLRPWLSFNELTQKLLPKLWPCSIWIKNSNCTTDLVLNNLCLILLIHATLDNSNNSFQSMNAQSQSAILAYWSEDVCFFYCFFKKLKVIWRFWPSSKFLLLCVYQRCAGSAFLSPDPILFSKFSFGIHVFGTNMTQAIRILFDCA